MHLSTKTLKSFFRRYRADLLVTLGFFLFAVVMTWPFIIKPSSTLTAPLIGDVFNSVTKFEVVKDENLNPFFDSHVDKIAVPYGIKTNTGVDRVSFFSTAFLWIGTLLTSSVFAHNLLTFLGYFLTSSIMYLFVRSVFRSRSIAFVAGMIYGAFPLFVSLARAAPTYMHLWLFILPIWAFYKLAENFSKKRLAVTTVSVIPAVLWTPYFMYHVMLIAAALLLVYTFLQIKKRAYRRALIAAAISVASWAIVLTGYYIFGMSGGAESVPDRSISEIYEQSLHPLMLVLPGAFTWWGEAGYDKLVAIIPRAYDTNLYAGISVLALATLGALSLVTTKLRRNLTSSVCTVGWYAVAIVVLTFSFSIAPTISLFGWDIPTPNYLVAELVPSLRAGQRLLMPMMLGLVILASIGIHVALKLASSQNIRRIAYVTIVLVIAFDISSKPPQLTSQILHPPSIDKLSKAKPGTVVLYNNGSIVANPSQLACYHQLKHNMPIINHCGLDVDYPAGEIMSVYEIAEMPYSQQASVLNNIGVTYYIIPRHEKYLVDKLDLIKLGFREYTTDDRYIIYKK